MEGVGHVSKSYVACTSRRWCVEVVGGVWKSYVVCTSRIWCVQVVGGVYKSRKLGKYMGLS